jgi:hypothetical protein
MTVFGNGRKGNLFFDFMGKTSAVIIIPVNLH